MKLAVSNPFFFFLHHLPQFKCELGTPPNSLRKMFLGLLGEFQTDDISGKNKKIQQFTEQKSKIFTPLEMLGG